MEFCVSSRYHRAPGLAVFNGVAIKWLEPLEGVSLSLGDEVLSMVSLKFRPRMERVLEEGDPADPYPFAFAELVSIKTRELYQPIGEVPAATTKAARPICDASQFIKTQTAGAVTSLDSWLRQCNWDYWQTGLTKPEMAERVNRVLSFFPQPNVTITSEDSSQHDGHILMIYKLLDGHILNSLFQGQSNFDFKRMAFPVAHLGFKDNQHRVTLARLGGFTTGEMGTTLKHGLRTRFMKLFMLWVVNGMEMVEVNGRLCPKIPGDVIGCGDDNVTISLKPMSQSDITNFMARLGIKVTFGVSDPLVREFLSGYLVPLDPDQHLAYMRKLGRIFWRMFYHSTNNSVMTAEDWVQWLGKLVSLWQEAARFPLVGPTIAKVVQATRQHSNRAKDFHNYKWSAQMAYRIRKFGTMTDFHNVFQQLYFQSASPVAPVHSYLRDAVTHLYGLSQDDQLRFEGRGVVFVHEARCGGRFVVEPMFQALLEQWREEC